MPRPSLIIVLSIILAALLGIVAYFAEGYWQATLLGIATVFFTIAASEALVAYRGLLDRPIFYVTLLTVGVAALIGTTLYLGYSLINLTRVRPYPLASGLIADFTGGTGGMPRTALGTQCAIVSDSAQDLDSRIGYKRIDADSNGNGFLRLTFELKSQTDATPFAGIFCSFSFFPEIPYDVSRFRNLAFVMRGNEAAPPFSVHVTLYSHRGSAPQMNYVFPSYPIAASDVSKDWKVFSVPFYEFRPPAFSHADAAFDPGSAYRVAFVVFGKPHSDVTGSIDLDDIKFAMN